MAEREMTMVERVARAIYATYREAEGAEATWDDLERMSTRPGYPNAKRAYMLGLAEARAAIVTLRNLTPAMQRAGDLAGFKANVRDVSKDVFQAVIDAALSETLAQEP